MCSSLAVCQQHEAGQLLYLSALALCASKSLAVPKACRCPGLTTISKHKLRQLPSQHRGSLDLTLASHSNGNLIKQVVCHFAFPRVHILLTQVCNDGESQQSLGQVVASRCSVLNYTPPEMAVLGQKA